MSIELLTQEEYETLYKIQKEFPALTFQNKGYQYINRNKFTDAELSSDKTVTKILKSKIKGFSEFNNFLLNKEGEVCIRVQAAYNEHFIGVRYYTLRELRYGFDSTATTCPPVFPN